MNELMYMATKNQYFKKRKDDYINLVNELKAIRSFRNKVAAHVAYTYPKDFDTPDTIVNSMLNLFPEEGGITLGTSAFMGGMDNSQIPEISIFKWDEEIKKVFESWKKLFIKSLCMIKDQYLDENDNFRIKPANFINFQKKV